MTHPVVELLHAFHFPIICVRLIHVAPDRQISLDVRLHAWAGVMSCASLRNFPERKTQCELFPTGQSLWRFAGLFGPFETALHFFVFVCLFFAHGLRLSARIFGRILSTDPNTCERHTNPFLNARAQRLEDFNLCAWGGEVQRLSGFLRGASMAVWVSPRSRTYMFSCGVFTCLLISPEVQVVCVYRQMIVEDMFKRKNITEDGF